MIKLKDILNEQQTKTVKGVDYWRKSEGEPWQAIDKCVTGNCHHGKGETIGEDGSFIGEFKNGKRWQGVLTGPKGDHLYVNGKAEVLREPEEREGGFLSVALNSIIPTDYFNLLPVNAKAWVKDLAGIKKTITSKDFSVNDLLVLIEIVKRLKKEGRFVITPNDYELKGGFLYNKPDEKGNFKVYSDLSNVEDSFKDTTQGALYRLRTTLGHARFGTDAKGNTVVVDEYDFNNAIVDTPNPSKGAIRKKQKGYEIIKSILNNPTDVNYAKLRKISASFGSAAREGAHVYINLGDEANI